jgi:hypothetical protein
MLCQHDVVELPSRGVLNGMCLGAITTHEEAAPKTRRNNKFGAAPRVVISDDVRPMFFDDVVRVLQRAAGTASG